MQAKQYLKNSDLVLGTKGYIDILANELNTYLNTAGAVTANNAAIVAIIAERNNVHTRLGDGITDVAPVTVAVAADNGGKARYIVRELLQCMEGNVPYGVSLIRDESIAAVVAAPTDPPQLLGDYINGVTTIITTVAQRSTMLALRATSLAAVQALWVTVSTL